MDELEVELEALSCTYGESLRIQREADTTLVAVDVVPHGEERFVELELQLLVQHQHYPASPPSIRLAEVRGLGDERQQQLHRALREEGARLGGEMMLGQLVEAATALLSELNQPEGCCIFCLEPLAASPAVKLSACYHVLHASCFHSWWAWRQLDCERQQRELEQHTGAAAASRLAASTLPAKQGDHFQVDCPTCRTAVADGDLFSERQGLQRALQAQQAAQASGQEASCKMSEGELLSFRQLQARHAALFTRQQQRGGIVEEPDYSLSALQLNAQLRAQQEAVASASSSAGPAQQAEQRAAQQREAGGSRGRGGDRSGRGREQRNRHRSSRRSDAANGASQDRAPACGPPDAGDALPVSALEGSGGAHGGAASARPHQQQGRGRGPRPAQPDDCRPQAGSSTPCQPLAQAAVVNGSGSSRGRGGSRSGHGGRRAGGKQPPLPEGHQHEPTPALGGSTGEGRPEARPRPPAGSAVIEAA